MTGSRRTTPTVVFVAAFLIYGLAVSVSIRENSPTFDEGGHVVAGLVYLHDGDLAAYHHNPPLAKILFALPSVGLPLSTGHLTVDPVNSNWINFALPFMREHRDTYLLAVNRARFISLLFAVFGALIAQAWALQLWGRTAGWLVLLLWLTHPTLLAYAGLATPDMAGAVFYLAVFYLMRRFGTDPRLGGALAVGALLGLGLVTRFSNLLAFPVALVLFFVQNGCRLDRRRVALLATASTAAVVVINAGYLFQDTPTRLGDLTFRSETLSGEPLRFNGSQFYAYPQGNRFADTWLANVPLPVPRELLLGLDDQKSHAEYRLPAYLLGTWRQHGGWVIYYLVGFLAKTPLVVLLAFVGAIGLAWRRPASRADRVEELFLVVPPAFFLLVASLETGINSHYRYILPVLPFVLISIGRLGPWLDALGNRLGRRRLAIAVVMLAALPVASVFPRQLSYFNLAVGGPSGGPKVLLDSNIDWGQDLVALRRWLRTNRRAQPLSLYYFGTTPPSLFGIHGYTTTDFQRIEHIPPGTLIAISVNVLYGLNTFVLGADEARRPRPSVLPVLLRDLEPVGRAGYSIYIYQPVPP